MSSKIVVNNPFEISIHEYELPKVSDHDVHIKTVFSGISAGTEMSQYRGTSPFLNKLWDPTSRLFRESSQSSLSYPIDNFGYEESGVVVAVGKYVQKIHPGQYVFGPWGHKTDHIADESYAIDHLMPDGLDPICGIFSHIGAVALNGVHDAHIRIGETVAVFGLGVLGQIVCQAVRASGAKVIAVDLIESRLETARKLGVFQTINAGDQDVAQKIKTITAGKGADVCIEVSGSTIALQQAIRSAAYSARVVAMGFFQGEAKELYLGEEFHHNRINLVCSQISGTDPELKYRWDKLRLWQTAIQLQADGLLNLTPLITHRVPFSQTSELFDMIDKNPTEIMQTVIEF
jgi:threonine dehydrogenase-like Zn-dependent dehydrogenase